MEIELVEIREFLAAHRPFDALPAEALDRLPASLSVRYLRRGSPFPPQDADGQYLYLVRKGAVDMRDSRGELADKLGEGDLYSPPCVGEELAAGMTCVTAEDTLLYLLPCERLQALRRDHEDFDRHFDASLVERLRKAIDQLQQAPSGGGRLLTVEVASLITRPPVFVSPDASIRDAARRMASARVSSILVVEGEALVGLMTDRDLRSRCIAAGLDTARPVRDIMSTKLHTIGPSTLGFDALMRMTQLNVHHLPVVDSQRVLGVITASDMVRHESANAVYLVRDAHKAESVEALAGLGRKLPELQMQLAVAGASERNVGEAISAVNDAITQRLIELAEAKLGPAPAAYAWVTGGSHARREQMSRSDQDNALILADDARPEDDPYFESLARFVNDGLAESGLVYCPGEVMASNPKWRQRASQWRRYFDGWIDQPEPLALMLASVFFDLRVVHGEPALLDGLRRENLGKCRANAIFLGFMAKNALANRPPLGFFRNLVLIHGGEHDKTFDIKRRGIVPVVDLARVHALAAGRAELNTVDRLRAAAGSQSVTAEGAANLEDAYRFIATLRVQHQARQLRSGRKVDNFVATDELSALERSQLKDAFAIIATLQETLESRFLMARIA